MSKTSDPLRTGSGTTATPRESRITLFHLLIIVLSLVMTIGAWQFSKQQIETRTHARFEAERDRVIGLIRSRMQRYEALLWAGASTVESHGGTISYEEWKSFARNLRIGDRYPGIGGIAVIHYLDDEAVPEYLEDRRAERSGFDLRSKNEGPIRLAVSFIEPEAPNAKAVGFDLSNEANRRNGAFASRDTGEARITGPITLVQDTGRTPGFLFYVPFYEGAVPETVEGRREAILGFVNAAFVTRKLMEGLLAQDLRGVRFSITDGDTVIYDEHVPGERGHDPDPLYSETVPLDLYGRTWTLDMRTNLAFRAANTYAQPTFILLGGLLIEGLIIALLVLMARANRRAIAYADRVTLALKEESAKLREANRTLSGKNEELEQFAYVTSHDLKTPVRGIGGLVEMIQDDLEDYLLSPQASPDVAMNLDRIRDRLRRMNALTDGIMEFSRTGTQAEGDPVELEPALGAMASDFGLDPGQIVLKGDVDTITADAFTFQRVLENLVANAVKYHPDPEALRIGVTVQGWGETCRVEISDNGPGIDPRHHDRIFDMFQTLQTGNASGSTGIGLAIVRKAVERHGGRITVTSTPGSGATFSFDWPLRHAHDGAARTDEAA